jgi:hypothetical protein
MSASISSNVIGTVTKLVLVFIICFKLANEAQGAKSADR